MPCEPGRGASGPGAEGARGSAAATAPRCVISFLLLVFVGTRVRLSASVPRGRETPFPGEAAAPGQDGAACGARLVAESLPVVVF